jgi:hypothetical protein
MSARVETTIVVSEIAVIALLPLTGVNPTMTRIVGDENVDVCVHLLSLTVGA